MKVITVIQPWATLIALGEKKFETRSWATKHRGPLAIHAGKKVDKEAIKRLSKAFPDLFHEINIDYDEWPTGVIVATAKLEFCWRVSDWLFDHETKIPYLHSAFSNYLISKDEYAFGDYTPGRFAWELTDVRQIAPVLAKGQQGLWNWKEGESHEHQ